MTREEFESILEEAYIEGYNTAIEDIQEDILDEEAYDLEDEYDYYTEARGDTKLDKIRKAAVKGAGMVGKELGFSPKTLSAATRTTLAATSGNMDPKTRAKQAAKNAGRLMTGLVRDRDKVGKNVYRAGNELKARAAELAPHEKYIRDDKSLQKKGEIGRRLLSGTLDKYKKIASALTGHKGDEDENRRNQAERSHRQYVADRVKRAIERKQEREQQAAKNRAWDKEMSEKYQTPRRMNTYTKSGKFYNDDGKQGRKAIW